MVSVFSEFIEPLVKSQFYQGVMAHTWGRSSLRDFCFQKFHILPISFHKMCYIYTLLPIKPV